MKGLLKQVQVTTVFTVATNLYLRILEMLSECRKYLKQVIIIVL